jgi:phosphoribosylamine---glycine ligase
VTDLTLLVIGSGGREHTLAWALARSPRVQQIYVAPGNAGTEWPAEPERAAAVNIPIAAENLSELVEFAQNKHIDLVVVGPEAPLALGLVDHLRTAGIRVFGPTQAAAQLEVSKSFSKAFMQQIGIPTAEYASFDTLDAAQQFVRQLNKPVVIKADGLAAGKGVILCDTPEEADVALHRILVKREFGDAGQRVIVEERLSGPEVSALAFCDGHTVAFMPLARDHKRVFDGDAGPNTGGMGAYAPVPDLPPELIEFIQTEVLQRTVSGMAERGTPYSGVLYAGLMLTPDGPKVLEFNCRFGDPETQVILPLLANDLAEIMLACADGTLNQVSTHWRKGACATVVAASPGYPSSYPKGLEIHGLAQEIDETIVFHAGTTCIDEQIVTAGGRVLSVSGIGDTLATALDRAYDRIGQIHFEGMHYRRDIGRQPQGVTLDTK